MLFGASECVRWTGEGCVFMVIFTPVDDISQL